MRTAKIGPDLRLVYSFFYFFYPSVIALCVVSVLQVMIIFELLVVLNIENHLVELTGLAYSREFDNIFALSCREPKMMSRNAAKFRDRANRYGIVSMREMTCDEWPHIKKFGRLIISLEQIDVSLLLLTLNDA